MGNESDFSVLQPYQGFQLPTEVTVRAAAELAASYINYMGEREKWSGKLSQLRMALDSHALDGIRALQVRQLEAETAALCIEAARGLNDSSAVVSIFQLFMDKSPDFLSSLTDIIASHSQS